MLSKLYMISSYVSIFFQIIPYNLVKKLQLIMICIIELCFTYNPRFVDKKIFFNNRELRAKIIFETHI